MSHSGPSTVLRGSAALALALLCGAAVVPAAQAADPVPTPLLTIEFDAVGTTHIGGQVQTDVSFGPTVLTTVVDTTTVDVIDGTMPVPTQKVAFRIGDVPARTDVTLTQVGPATGTVRAGAVRGQQRLTALINYDLAVSNAEVNLLGTWVPLNVGDDCHTAEPVTIAAATPDGEGFTIAAGGRLTGTYTVGAFTGCSTLVGDLVSASDHTVELTISNPRNIG